MASVVLDMKAPNTASPREALAASADAAAMALAPKPRAEQVAYIEHHILNAVAAQSAVEEQDEERGQDAHPAHPAELLAKGLICATAALACLTTMASSPTMTMKPQQTAKMR